MVAQPWKGTGRRCIIPARVPEGIAPQASTVLVGAQEECSGSDIVKHGVLLLAQEPVALGRGSEGGGHGHMNVPYHSGEASIMGGTSLTWALCLRECNDSHCSLCRNTCVRKAPT